MLEEMIQRMLGRGAGGWSVTRMQRGGLLGTTKEAYKAVKVGFILADGSFQWVEWWGLFRGTHLDLVGLRVTLRLAGLLPCDELGVAPLVRKFGRVVMGLVKVIVVANVNLLEAEIGSHRGRNWQSPHTDPVSLQSV